MLIRELKLLQNILTLFIIFHLIFSGDFAFSGSSSMGQDEEKIKVAELLLSAKKNIIEGKYNSARESIDEAIEMDPGNSDAERLLKLWSAEGLNVSTLKDEIAQQEEELAAMKEAAGVPGKEEVSTEKSDLEEAARKEAARKERELAKAKRQAERINKYLLNANKYLNKQRFDAARSYAKKAVNIDKENAEANQLLIDIDKAEAAYEQAKELEKQQEEARKEAERIAKEKAKEAELAKRKAEKEAKRKAAEAERISNYLMKANKYLNEQRFSSARSYAKRVINMDEQNAEANQLLIDIDKAEAAYEQEEELKKKQEEARKEAERIAKEKAKEAERIADEKTKEIELAKSEPAEDVKEEKSASSKAGGKGLLDLLFFGSAEKSEAKEEEAKPEAVEPAEHETAEEMKHETAEEVKEEQAAAPKTGSKGLFAWLFGPPAKKSEAGVKEEQAKEDQAKEAPGSKAAKKRKAELRKQMRQAEIAAKKRVREAARQERIAKRIQKKVDGLLSRSKAYLNKGDYDNARYYAYKACKIDPTNSDVMSQITDINKAELTKDWQEEEKEMPKRLEKTAKEAETDVMKEYDEGKTWTEQVAEVFGKKTIDMCEGVNEEHVFTINECVDEALRRSLRMNVAEKQVKLAEMRVWEARRDLFPSVTARYEMSSGKIAADGYGRHYRGNKYQIEVNQTVFDGMGMWYAVRQAQTNMDVVKLEMQKIKNEVIEDVKKAYYNLDKAYKALNIQDWFKKKVNELFDIVDKSYEQDIVPRVEYLKVKAQNIQADFQYVSAGEDVKLAEMILFQAMDLPYDKHIKIEPVESPKEKLPIGLNNCYELALANRPDLRIKAKMIEYYNFERKMMKSKGWPKIDFNGSFGGSYENYEPLFLPTDITGDASGPARSGRTMQAEWYAGAKGSIPLWGNTFEYNYVREHWAPTVSSFRGSESATSYFSLGILDNLAYFSNLQEAKIGFDRAKYEYQKAENDLLVEVKETYFKYKKSVLQMDVAKAQIEHQRTLVDVFGERHRLNEMETSRLIEEIIKLSEYEYGSVQGEADYYISLTELNKAIGVSGYFIPQYEEQQLETLAAEAIAKVPVDSVEEGTAVSGEETQADPAEGPEAVEPAEDETLIK